MSRKKLSVVFSEKPDSPTAGMENTFHASTS